MTIIERLRMPHDWAWTDPTWGASWPGEPEKRCPSCDCPWPCALPALLDVAEAARVYLACDGSGVRAPEPWSAPFDAMELGKALPALRAALARLDGAEVGA